MKQQNRKTHHENTKGRKHEKIGKVEKK